MNSGVSVHIGESVDVPVLVQFAPGMSVLSVVGDVLGIPQGVPASRRAQLRKSCDGSLLNAMTPVVATGSLRIPRVLREGGEGGPDAMRNWVEEIAQVGPESLLADLERMFGGEVPPAWRDVVDDPESFLIGFSRLVRSVWESAAPVWKQAKPLLEREVERVGVASVTGAMADLLANLSPRVAFVDGKLRLPEKASYAAGLEVRKLTLVPLVSGTRACVHRIDENGHAHIGYPVAGLASLLDGRGNRPEVPTDALALTLGDLRAVILRKGNQPVSMGKLAGLLHCTAGTVTYHCRQLEQAGLLCRERQGREVRILRTLRGDALVDALS